MVLPIPIVLEGAEEEAEAEEAVVLAAAVSLRSQRGAREAGPVTQNSQLAQRPPPGPGLLPPLPVPCFLLLLLLLHLRLRLLLRLHSRLHLLLRLLPRPPTLQPTSARE